MQISEPGIYRDFDGEAYFADPCPTPSVSQSICKTLIEQSPLHAKMEHPRLAPPVAEEDETAEKYDKAKAIGNAAHAMMLKRGKKITVIDAPNFQTKAAKEARAAAVMDGAEPVLKKHNSIASMMVIQAHAQLQQIEGCERAFHDGDAEVVVANCENGLWLRSMIDWITPDLREVWDLKTSGMSASPYGTGRMMASAGWHIQAAMHERILNAIDPDGAGRRKFRYVVQENESPFALTVNEIGEDALTIGRKQVDYAIMIWRDCVETNTWPAYPLRIIRPELPGYFSDSWIAREIREEDEREYSPRPKMLTSLAGG
jgi:hypothetical protein